LDVTPPPPERDGCCCTQHALRWVFVVGAVTCFKAENKFKHNPLLHSMWHIFGAIAIHQANKVLMT
jgi:hypothetical protein